MVFRYRSGWIFAYLTYALVIPVGFIVGSLIFSQGPDNGKEPLFFVLAGAVLLLVVLFFFVRVLCERVEVSEDSIKWFNWIGMENIHVRSVEILRMDEVVERYGRDRYVYPIDVYTTRGKFRFWSGITDGDELIAHLRECVEKRSEMNL